MVILLLGANTAIGEVYKWVDEDGKVHFGGRPQSKDAEAIDVKPAAPANTDARQRHERTQRVLEAFTAERKERENAQQAAKEEARERKRKCAAARAEQKRRESSAFLFYKDDDGNRRVIEGAEYDAAIKKARDAVAHWCS